MKKNNLAQAVTAAAVLLAVMALTSFVLSRRQMNQAEMIVRPGEQGQLGGEDPAQSGLADGVTVDTSNVLQVIRTLSRPEEYTFQAESTLSYHSVSSTLRVRGVVKGQRAKLQMLSAGGAVEKEMILAPSGYYAWQSGQASLYSGALGRDLPADGQLAAFCDEASRIPTYEDVLSLGQQDPDCLLDAGYTQRDGQPCIFVLVENRLANTRDSYYISIDTGLLCQADSEKNGMVVYRMKQTVLEETAVDESQFTLPNGQQVTEEAGRPEELN